MRILRFVFFMRPCLLLLLALSGIAQAADQTPSPGVSSASFLQAFLGLGMIVGFLLLFAWLARKFLGGKGFGQGGLKLLGGIALGPRERIVLVEAGDQWLVIGIVPGQIRALHTMPREILPPDASPATNPPPPFARSFAQWLQHFSKPRS
jgi:flagellar protein FliO/FliZ